MNLKVRQRSVMWSYLLVLSWVDRNRRVLASMSTLGRNWDQNERRSRPDAVTDAQVERVTLMEWKTLISTSYESQVAD